VFVHGLVYGEFLPGRAGRECAGLTQAVGWFRRHRDGYDHGFGSQRRSTWRRGTYLR
jgi:hypothetical protein